MRQKFQGRDQIRWGWNPPWQSHHTMDLPYLPEASGKASRAAIGVAPILP
jgi:hypothetical protein